MDLEERFRMWMGVVVLASAVTFAIAARSPALLLFGLMGVAVAWLLVLRRGGRPLTQWLVFVGAAAALGQLLLGISPDRQEMLQSIGTFILCLQLLLLLGPKSNREYGELLALTLLLVVCGSILTLSAAFALAVVVYVLVTLYALMLFQLKVTGDGVAAFQSRLWRRSPPVGASTGGPAGPRQRRDLLWTAGLVGTAALLVTVVLFGAVPRRDQTKMRPFGQRQVAFAQRIYLGEPPIGRGSREPVMTLRVRRNGVPVPGTEVFLLRGAVLARYIERFHVWEGDISQDWNDYYRVEDKGVELVSLPANSPSYEADIFMQPNEGGFLFTLAPISSIASDNGLDVLYSPFDQQFTTSNSMDRPLSYTVRAPIVPDTDYFHRYPPGFTPRGGPRPALSPYNSYARGWRSNRAVMDHLLETAVDSLILAEYRRDPSPARSRQVAEALVSHLRRNYQYDLDYPAPGPDEDPLLSFLLTHQRGHCELFAGALAALARTAGLPARVISGYQVSEYNRLGGYYVVRHTDAHAWTEIQIGDQWETFDPTPPARSLQAEKRDWLTVVDELYNYFEFGWFSAFTNFNVSSPVVLGAGSDEVPGQALPTSWGERIKAALIRLWDQAWLAVAAGAAVAVLLLGLTARAAGQALQRRRQRRLLKLEGLDRQEQRTLLEQLQFYLTMLDLLARHGYRRPSWQSPQTFAQALVDREGPRLSPVLPLTRLFYEVRFGGRRLDPNRRAELQAQMAALNAALAPRRAEAEPSVQ